jgi:hypothetical protein
VSSSSHVEQYSVINCSTGWKLAHIYNVKCQIIEIQVWNSCSCNVLLSFWQTKDPWNVCQCASSFCTDNITTYYLGNETCSELISRWQQHIVLGHSQSWPSTLHCHIGMTWGTFHTSTLLNKVNNNVRRSSMTDVIAVVMESDRG